MALSTCRDCGREVSTRARHCVHCGRPRPAAGGSGPTAAGVIAVIIALALTGVVVCAARRACKKMASRACFERRMDAPIDKSTFIRTLQKDEAQVIEVRPGLYQVKDSTVIVKPGSPAGRPSSRAEER